MCAYQSPIFGGSITLQNELMKLLSNDVEIPQLESTSVESDTNADEVIQDALVSNSVSDANPDLSGGTSISAMIDNVMSGGNVNTPPPDGVNSVDSKIIDEIYEFKGGDEANDNEDPAEDQGIEDDGEDEAAAVDDDGGEGDDSDDGEGDGDSDESDDELDFGSSEFKDRYVKLIKEFSQPFEKQNLQLVGGSKPSARRVKIINAFPYILKSAPSK